MPAAGSLRVRFRVVWFFEHPFQPGVVVVGHFTHGACDVGFMFEEKKL